MHAQMREVLLARGLREAVATMLAALGTLACSWLLAPIPAAAVLAVVLSVSLSRSHLQRDRRGRVEAALALPLVSLAALAVGQLLLQRPWLGAAVFVAGMSLPIWLRRFGPVVQRIGGLAGLPFVAVLVTPHLPTDAATGRAGVWLPVLVAMLALAWVSLLHGLLHRLWPRPAGAGENTSAPPTAAAGTSARMPASTRLAIQMAVALSVAFVVGYLLFPGHWSWVVVTAFLVGAGNRGRLDVAYKSLLRVVGAAAGTLGALLVVLPLGVSGGGEVVLMLVALFMGIWLRPLGYAWWALFITLALALLQGFEGESVGPLLAARLGEIVVGALIAVAAAWWVLPVRSSDVLRRRLADALAELAAEFDPEVRHGSTLAFNAALLRVEQLAPALRALRRFGGDRMPADWIDALLACRVAATALIDAGEVPAAARRALGVARRALREPTALHPALLALQAALVAAVPCMLPP